VWNIWQRILLCHAKKKTMGYENTRFYELTQNCYK